MFSDFCLSSWLICITVVIIGDKPTGLYIALMVKTGQFTTQCKDDNVICLKRQISFLLVDWQNR